MKYTATLAHLLRISRKKTLLLATLIALAAWNCGDEGYRFGLEDDDNDWAPPSGGADAGQSHNNGNAPFIPEQEEFLVREVATTESYVFVPNSDEESNTVALIDGRDFSVLPIRVGRQPTQVRATQLEDVGAVAYVLCEGSHVVGIIRADMTTGLDRGHVSLLPVPREVNSLALSPDGRHLLAYIDPTKPLGGGSSVASLQTMALIRLGDTPNQDKVFELSVTRLITSVQFTEAGDEAFIVGREGVNRLRLADILDDTFVPPIRLDLAGDLFPPDDQEVVVSSDGSFMVVRTSQYQGVAVYRFPADGQSGVLKVLELDAIPTDIDLIERPDSDPPRQVMATLRAAGTVALIDVDALFAADDQTDPASLATIIEVTGAQAGVARLSPDESTVLIYSTLIKTPLMGVLDLDSLQVRTYVLRNQIRSLAISTDSSKAVVVHRKQPGSAQPGADTLESFQHGEGLTIFDVASGYRRPVVLPGEPTDVILTQTADGTDLVYVMTNSPGAASQGLMRVDLNSFRSDFVRLPREPVQLGTVAGKVFVNQASSTGRITFFDPTTQTQRTVSGYELNAGIE